ncbi:conserved hypothetical protein [Candida dubliniensis CD36]|uniref:Uncharacterized protein n=1 Tax=Candida dubliniensis (strain CD36 / ATCC MYA-646 / CBS 7987 / NCPF 3949 / NRRL Y-17841) TaxID=573826 RepID=B9WM49_CANDC|nr:conserved hypothetical protein [Candida dubliniensis CD36]CAX40162.1 conserved hypothetical protein [Candida dubliniensis CD36]
MPDSSQNLPPSSTTSSTTTTTTTTPAATTIPLTNYNYYFLLKTENIEPLIDIVNRINQEINDNQKLIHSLCLQIDNHGKFPKTISNLNTNTKTNTNPSLVSSIDDPLRYLLEYKYNITSNPTPNNNNNGGGGAEDDYKQSLINDINQLRQLQQNKHLKNQQLLSIIDDYEQEIIIEILPGLRKLIKHDYYNDNDDNNIQGRQGCQKDILLVKKQFFLINKLIYEKYQLYIKRIYKLIKFIKIMINYIIKMKKQILKLKKLEIINEIKTMKQQQQQQQQKKEMNEISQNNKG